MNVNNKNTSSAMNVNNKNTSSAMNVNNKNTASPMNISRPTFTQDYRYDSTRSKPNSETDLIIKVKLPEKTVQQLRRITLLTYRNRSEYMGTIDMTRSNNGDIVFKPPSRQTSGNYVVQLVVIIVKLMMRMYRIIVTQASRDILHFQV